MEQASGGLVLQLGSALAAPRERVFRLLTDPAEVPAWWGPHGFTTPEAQLDAVVGGAYRFRMQPPEGEAFHLSGRFLAVDPPRRLVYTFGWEEPAPDDTETVVTVLLATSGAGTELSLRHEGFATPERLALHRDGWTQTLERLSEVAERG
jgi:uncharacterized protein YndB with AHSA1/START domain